LKEKLKKRKEKLWWGSHQGYYLSWKNSQGKDGTSES
jgi:hypothetical protein